MKNTLINILKFGLAIGLIYWLVQSGKLDFEILKQSFSTPYLVILGLLFLQLDNSIVAFRWRIILHQKTKNKIPFFQVFKANWIGTFFNAVLPGSITGDLIKIFYVKDLDENLHKKFLLVSIFIDRALGFVALLTLGGIFSLINYKKLISLSSDVATLVHINLLLLLVVAIVLMILFFFKNLPHAIAKPFRNIKILGTIVRKLEVLWNDLCLFREKVLLILALGFIVQGFAIFIFWFITRTYASSTFFLNDAYTFMPIGFTALAVPIAPQGLGVGHAIFQKLFSFFSIDNGASLFNIYFFYLLATNLTGVIPYLLSSTKGKVSISEMEKQDF